MLLILLAILIDEPIGQALAETWSQTTQQEFESNTLSGIDISTKPGEVVLNPPDDGTVLVMHFDEGNGLPQDSSSYNNHASSNNASWTNSGKFGSALSFDGKDDYVNIPYSTSLKIDKDATVEFWVKPASLPSGTHLLLSYGGSLYQNGYLLSQTSQNVLVYWKSAAQCLGSTTTPLSVGRWDHLAVTNNNGNLTLLVNGINIKTGTVGTSSFGNSATLMGGRSDSWYFNGAIDEVRICSDVRSSFSRSGGYYSSGTITSPAINSGNSVTNVRLDWTILVRQGHPSPTLPPMTAGCTGMNCPEIMCCLPSPGLVMIYRSRQS